MIKVGIADYGVNQWEGALYDYRDRLTMLKEIGFDGIERVEAKDAAEAIEIVADARQMGMDFATCRTNTSRQNIRFASALGLKYLWSEGSFGNNMELYTRRVNCQIEAAKKYGLKVLLHNHMGIVETPEQVETFLAKCPDAGLLLDIGHMVVAGGDPLYFIDKYFDRLGAVHMKDFVYKDKEAAEWEKRIRFCELGAGEMGDLSRQVLLKLKDKGYEGWIHVEHDTHLQEPAKDLKISRDYMRDCGI